MDMTWSPPVPRGSGAGGELVEEWVVVAFTALLTDRELREVMSSPTLSAPDEGLRSVVVHPLLLRRSSGACREEG
jgi:hypothetical protein